jgi:glutamate/tyrosine decarboxylase-like PLP-dependent enzyme
VYRDPSIARAAHTQHAEYLDVLHNDGAATSGADLSPSAGWNPSDYAHHLSRRARGLPFWFSLATHGTDAYRTAVESSLELARRTARLIDDFDHVELLVEPELSVVLFRRVGWEPARYQAWSDAALARQEAFVVPTTWDGETVLRFCFVNPVTTIDDVVDILDSLR